MLKAVHYGPHVLKPWCPGTGYVDPSAKSLKSYRCREPQSIWQALPAKTEDPGEYDLYVCKRCLLYSAKQADIEKHEPLCRYRSSLPGTVVYEDEKYVFREVRADGKNMESVKLYLQCLSLLGSLFLSTKSISFAIDAFVFYVALDKQANLVAGFFSKEIHSWHDYNLACIVVFPPFQGSGLGQRLIRLSYWLTRRNKMVGSPEKPLSHHGALAYKAYWKKEIAMFAAKHVQRKQRRKISLNEIAQATGIDPRDLASVIKQNEALTKDQDKELKLHKMDIKPIKPPLVKNDKNNGLNGRTHQVERAGRS